MTFLGVPVLDWVILGALLVLAVEAWITCRPAKRRPAPIDERAGPPDAGHPPG
ncbi:MAG: hypothetical protein LW860_03140 [Xanthomonadaceae bacterium]|jgi:hypothetical protein|nr:hypothetical protein [Xanthomonadaceae bacterium]